MEMIGAFGVGLLLYNSMIIDTKSRKKKHFKKTGRNTYKYIGGK